MNEHDVYLNWVSTTQLQGYRTECPCGCRGPIEDDREAAQDDGWEHEKEGAR